MTHNSLRAGLAGLVVTVIAVGSVLAAASTGGAASAFRPAYVPPIKHVFVINIENKGYDATWTDKTAAPYLSVTLRRKGVLLNSYYGTAHNSQPNYVAEISGQGPNPQMQADCQVFSTFVSTGTVSPGQAQGTGCVFDSSVPDLPHQLTSAHLNWAGYMEGMQTPCQHPALNSSDGTQKADGKYDYAVRHNPFVYFRHTIDHQAYCDYHVRPLTRLTTDLKAVEHTPNLVFITPDLCSDGHDAPCADGRPGGLKVVNEWMKVWIPRILASPAFRTDGVLVITADESDSPQTDATACCGEGASANSPEPGIAGPGGGRIGALVISRWVKPDSWSTTPYNHYSLLASIEEIFGLGKLGYAQTAGLHRFGLDVYTNWPS